MKEFGLRPETNQNLIIRGKRLKAIRVAREIKIKDAAPKLYLKAEQLDDIENGKADMTFEQIKAASRLYNVTVPFICRGLHENRPWQTWKKHDYAE